MSKMLLFYFALVCWVTAPLLIPIKEAQDQLQFSRFLDVIQFRAQCAVITNSFNKAMERSKKKARARRKASNNLNTLNLAKWNLPKKKKNL